MIGKTGKKMRGSNLVGLLHYLYGPARSSTSVHENPRLVATWLGPGDCGLEPPPTGEQGRNGWPLRDVSELAAEMQAPMLAAARVPKDPVWHLVLHNRENDRVLTDAEWAEIAAKVTAALGFDADPATGRAPVRWIAVRHDDQGIHLAAMLARQDGTIPSLHNDFHRIREVCRWAENTFGLTATNDSHHAAARATTRAETEKIKKPRRERAEPSRQTLRRLVRQAAAAARDASEFETGLDAAGVRIHYRYSQQHPDQITGYAVALPDDLDAGGEPVFYGGRSLAADLTWPKLTAGWDATASAVDDPAPAHDDVPAGHRHKGAYSEALGAVRNATAAAADPGLDAELVDELVAGADAVVTAAMYTRTGSYDGRRKPNRHTRRHIQTADTFEHTGRRPPPRRRTRIGAGLTRAAYRLMSGAKTKDDPDRAWFELAAELSRLAVRIAEHRLRQGRAAQAASASEAARQLAALKHPVGLLSGLPGINPAASHSTPPPGSHRTPSPGGPERRRAR